MCFVRTIISYHTSTTTDKLLNAPVDFMYLIANELILTELLESKFKTSLVN